MTLEKPGASASAAVAVPLSETPTVAPTEITNTSKRTSAADADDITESHKVVEKTIQPVLSENPTMSSHKDGPNGEVLELSRTREDGTEYPTGIKIILIALALCLSVFLVALDNSIIATAIPSITTEFESVSDVGWYGSSYLLTTAAFQLLFGRFYTFFSIKWIFLIAIGLFEIGSLVCGVAPDSVTLIIGRAVAGIGSAGIFSGALIILAHSVPLAKRPLYTGLIGSMYCIASVSGPLLGGVFTDEATWRWCFYINLPIGAITVVVIMLYFPDPKRAAVLVEPWSQRIRRFDPLGTFVFMPGVICLLLALQWGGTEYPWDNYRMIILYVFAAVLLSAFIVDQWWMQEKATVPPRIAAKRSIWSSACFAFFVGAAFLCAIYYVPIWFQAVKGASATRSGIMNIPMLIAIVLFSVGAGIMVSIFGYYNPFMICGTVLMSVGFGLITTFDLETPSSEWIGFQIIAGAGVGMAMQQPLMAVQTVLDIKDVPIGTALIVFAQTLGGALFVAVGQTVFTNGLIDYVDENAPGLDPMFLLVTGATSIRDQIPPEYLDVVIAGYNSGLQNTFAVSAATACATALVVGIVEWKSVKGMNVEMSAA